MPARLAAPLLIGSVAFLMAVAILWQAGSRRRQGSSVADMDRYDGTLLAMLVLALLSLALFAIYVLR